MTVSMYAQIKADVCMICQHKLLHIVTLCAYNSNNTRHPIYMYCAQ